MKADSLRGTGTYSRGMAVYLKTLDCRLCLFRRSGFTLIELLVSVTILAVLIGLLAAGLNVVQKKAWKTEAVSNMRMIGSAMLLYTGDNGGRLPGPLWPGQMPEFDPGREGRLVRELAPYLNLETPAEPELVDLFIPPAYRRAAGVPALNEARTFVMNMAVETDSGRVVVPWGNLADFDNPGGQPVMLSRVPGSAWAFSDADQLHPRVASASWSGNTPSEIIHGEQRLALFFGGHVAPIPQEELE